MCVHQALNNWGLVLQELTALRSPSERAYLVDAAVSKFRRAIRLRPDFDRACYNLGTVCYAHASSLNAEDADEVSVMLGTAFTACSPRTPVSVGSPAHPCTTGCTRLWVRATFIGLHV